MTNPKPSTGRLAFLKTFIMKILSDYLASGIFYRHYIGIINNLSGGESTEFYNFTMICEHKTMASIVPQPAPNGLFLSVK